MQVMWISGTVDGTLSSIILLFLGEDWSLVGPVIFLFSGFRTMIDCLIVCGSRKSVRAYEWVIAASIHS